MFTSLGNTCVVARLVEERGQVLTDGNNAIVAPRRVGVHHRIVIGCSLGESLVREFTNTVKVRCVPVKREAVPDMAAEWLCHPPGERVEYVCPCRTAPPGLAPQSASEAARTFSRMYHRYEDITARATIAYHCPPARELASIRSTPPLAGFPFHDQHAGHQAA